MITEEHHREKLEECIRLEESNRAPVHLVYVATGDRLEIRHGRPSETLPRHETHIPITMPYAEILVLSVLEA